MSENGRTSSSSSSPSSSSSEEFPDFNAEARPAIERLSPFDPWGELRTANAVIRDQRAEINRLSQRVDELEDKILDKDDDIHNWWVASKTKDQELAKKEEEIEEKKEEIAALKTELEAMRANQEVSQEASQGAKVGGGEGERSAKRRRSQ